MKKPIILIVDDEKIVLDSLKAELKDSLAESFRIETAEGGEEAIELTQELLNDSYEIPLVISDYIMPDIKGDDLLRLIHSISPKTRKIMLTGQADLMAVGNAVNYASLYRFITKPWNQNDLLLTIKEAVKSYENEIFIEEQNKEIRELNKNLERKVEERTKELIEVLASKDKFFSIIAHDLKNPLSVMLASEELLLENFDLYSKDKIKELVEKLQTGTKKITSLLLNLLEWARSQTGNIPYKPEQVNIREIVADCVGLLKDQADNKKILLTHEITEPILLHCDKNMIRTVFRNLISNALKFTPAQGQVTVEASIHNNFKVFSVKDTGVGMSPERVKNLFKIDHAHSTKGTEKEHGTGLGLLICKEFVDKNNGKISVESEPNKGSRFIITFAEQPEELS